MVSPEGPDDVELVLEPNANPAAKTFQQAMFAQGIPLTAFEVSDLKAEFARLKEQQVAFTQEPTPMGPVMIAVFSDTCGNLIQRISRSDTASPRPSPALIGCRSGTCGS